MTNIFDLRSKPKKHAFCLGNTLNNLKKLQKTEKSQNFPTIMIDLFL